MKINKNLIWLLLLTLLVSGTVYGAVTITTPTVNTGELIRAGDWNKIRADLDSLNSALDIYGNQSWQSSGGNMYYLNGKVGIGVATPPAQLGVYKESPAANETMFQIGTGADDDKFTIDEDGDITADGTMLLRGGTLYDSSGGLELHGEDDVYVGIDWNNNDADNRSFVIGKNAAGPGTNWEEIMVVQEDGKVGIGTTAPAESLHILNGNQIIESSASAYTRYVDNGGTPRNFYSGINFDAVPNVYSVGNKDTDKAFMAIDLNGNVGIGTTAPGYPLTVNGRVSIQPVDGTSSNNFVLKNTSTGTGNATLTFEAGSSGSAIHIAANGSVGIGTNSPSSKLDVLGTIRAEEICDETGANCQDISAGWASGGGYSEGAGFYISGNGQSVPNSTVTKVSSFSSNGTSLEDLDNSTYSNGVITIGSEDAGWWQLNGRVADALGGTGLFVYIYRNESSISSASDRTATSVSGSHYVSTSTAFKLEAGDEITLRTYQNSGSTVSTDGFSLSGVKITTGSGGSSGGSSPWTESGSDISRSAGKVGIGTTTPASELDVSGTIRAEEICDETGSNCQDISAGWASGGSSSGSGGGASASAFSVNKNGTGQNIPNTPWTKLTWSGEAFDTNNEFSNNRFTPKTSGKYFLNTNIYTGGVFQGAESVGLAIYKNGVRIQDSFHYNTGSVYTERTTVSVTALVEANGSTDYFEVYFYNYTHGTMLIDGNSTRTNFSGYAIGSGSSPWTESGGDISRSSGKVGIGTTNPSRKLDIAGIIKSNSPSGWSGMDMYLNDTNRSTIYNDSNFPSSVAIDTGGAQRMIVTSSGNVGIGTTSPSQKLVVGKDIGGLTVSNAMVLGSDGANRFFMGNDTNNFLYLYKISSTHPSASARNDFRIGGKHAGGVVSTYLTIDAPTGNVGIGTISPSAKLSVAGTANKTGGGSWATFSDARLKDIQGDYTKGLNEITQLNPVEFSYKENNALEWDSEKTYQGLIAQEVQKTFPEAVTKSSNTYLELDTLSIDMAIINAIKELKDENEALKTRIENLEKE